LGGDDPALFHCHPTKTHDMSLKFFLVGGVIFAVYMFLTIWNIFNGSKSPSKRVSTREEE
jgi:hypothetical protein